MTARLLHELRLLAVAIQFLTRWPVRLPASAAAAWDERWLTDCVRHFPAVGALLGAAVGLVLWAASLLWPPAVAAVLAVALGTWWTGAFHEDGLADTFDALGGSTSRERALVIELDGGQHNEHGDKSRTGYLNSEGYAVLRFWNHDVLSNSDGVAEAIVSVLDGHPSPDWRFAPATLSPEGRGKRGVSAATAKRRSARKS